MSQQEHKVPGYVLRTGMEGEGGKEKELGKTKMLHTCVGKSRHCTLVGIKSTEEVAEPRLGCLPGRGRPPHKPREGTFPAAPHEHAGWIWIENGVPDCLGERRGKNGRQVFHERLVRCGIEKDSNGNEKFHATLPLICDFRQRARPGGRRIQHSHRPKDNPTV